jgi:Zn-dependent protease with chaperone function
MVYALKRLHSMTKLSTPEPTANMRAFMITEPDSFFSTHPSLENRIKALEENYKLA